MTKNGKRLNEAQVRSKLATACGQAGGVNAFAKQHGMSGAFVSMVRTGKRPPSARILKALGLTIHVEIRSSYAVASPRRGETRSDVQLASSLVSPEKQ